MNADEPVSVIASANGAKGIALMVPAIGLPVAFHLFGGVVAIGTGILALSAALLPLSGELSGLVRKVSGEPAAPEKGIRNTGIADVTGVPLQESVTHPAETP